MRLLDGGSVAEFRNGGVISATFSMTGGASGSFEFKPSITKVEYGGSPEQRHVDRTHWLWSPHQNPNYIWPTDPIGPKCGVFGGNLT